MPTDGTRSTGNGGGQPGPDAHSSSAAAVPQLPAANDQPMPDARARRAGGAVNGQTTPSAQGRRAAAAPPGLPAADVAPVPTPQARREHDGGRPAREPATPSADALVSDPSVPLRLAADSLLDVERLRIATENRIRALSEIPGWELTPAALRWQAHLADLRALEHQVELELVRALRHHPLGQWVKRTVGIGEKQGARLLGALGDPAWNALEQRPRRGPAELWAFCGYVPGQRRRKGERSNWNAAAKMRAYLVAESCVKQRHSPYRPVYDAARASWAERQVPDAHKHAHGLRLVAKAVLRDMWMEAMRLREVA
jgi:hypothetical protein